MKARWVVVTMVLLSPWWVRARANAVDGAAAAQHGREASARARTHRDSALLDTFDTTNGWSATGTDAVGAKLEQVPGSTGDALCLAYDFSRASGFATLRRELPLTFPVDFELRLQIRGSGAANHFQLKLVDASGDNVWWVSRPEFVAPAEWTDQRYKARHVQFAWGPTPDRRLKSTAALELVVAAGSGGGAGELCFDNLQLVERKPLPAAPTPVVTSSLRSDKRPDLAMIVDGKPGTSWTSSDNKPRTLTVDLGQPREFGGLLLRWAPGLGARRYTVSLSDDGTRWRDRQQLQDSDGGVDTLRFPEAEARWLRLDLQQSQGKRFALAELQIRDLDFGSTPDRMLAALAAELRRGALPRAYYGEQTYWTVLGVDGGAAQALLSEDGALEPFMGAPSLEPFLVSDGKVRSWADARIRHRLRDDDLPMPGVRWDFDDGVALDVDAFVDGSKTTPRLLARYRLSHSAAHPRAMTLALAVRPLQVNPPVQFLNTPGGFSRIGQLELDRGHAVVDSRPALFALTPADGVVAKRFEQGLPLQWLADVATPQVAATAARSNDAAGLSSGALLWTRELAAGESLEVVVAMPMVPADRTAPTLAQTTPEDWFEARQQAVASQWRQRLDKTRIDVGAAPDVGNTLRTALAHILINRQGPSIRPGTRSYARSWIRDGAMTSVALLRLGQTDVVREFLDWYLPHQFANGKVPCCVDPRGADPVVENDSHGELIHLVHELYRYDHDRDALATRWPAVQRAIAYMDDLRAGERGERNAAPERSAYRGLLPPSISHEGYSDKPAYAYWDNAWGLLGYKDAADLAEALGLEAEATRIAAERDRYRSEILASLAASMKRFGIDFLPGAADRGDFDATSTTIALSPGGEQAQLPQAALRNTFQRYWDNFSARRDGQSDSVAYTPYEWRVVGALLRLGEVDRARQAIAYFMADRRPLEWNQWGEVVGHALREPRFIGDMPHGWVASDFIRSVLDVFAYEREADHSLVIAAGVPDTWRAGDGVSVRGLHTPWGTVSYTLVDTADGVTTLRIDGHLQPPPGGLRWPFPGSVIGALPAGIRDDDGAWVIRTLPAVLRVRPGSSRGPATPLSEPRSVIPE